MARTGRPPKPIEQKRRTGNPGGRALPDPATVHLLPMADGTPDPPPELELAGRGLWERIWSTAITWVSPDSDMDAVISACRLKDDLEVARRRYRATSDPADGRMVAVFEKQLAESLSVLGFNPTARARLGLAEVKKVDKLDQILSRRHRAAGD